MNKEILAQSLRHRREAICYLLDANGLGLGFTRQTLRYVAAWYFSQEIECVPKKMQDKVANIFQQIVSAAELEKVDDAVIQYVQGDDSELRPYIKRRACIEIGCITNGSNFGPPGWRSRKFSEPLYLTPAGFLRAYPECDDDLFIDSVHAGAVRKFHQEQPSIPNFKNAAYRVFEPAILGRIGGPGFKRWLREVKGKTYVEPRKSLAESYAIYQDKGRSGLQELYSPTYVYALIRKFNAEGLAVQKKDFDRIVQPKGFSPVH